MMLHRIARAWAYGRIVASTLLAYARIARVVVSERLWRLPERLCRSLGGAAQGNRGMLP
jgi:hypothetical protein